MKITLTAKSKRGEKTEHIMELPPENNGPKKVTVVLNLNEHKADCMLSEVFNGTVRQAIDKYAREYKEQMDESLMGPISMKEAKELITDMYYFEQATVEEK